MEYRKLGRSGLQVSALSLGSWLTFGKQINDNTAEDLMSVAYEAGVNFFDNAEAYANGKSETVMGAILKKMGWERSSYVVSSKVYFGDGGKLPNQKGLSRKHIMEGCNASLKRLQLDYVDLYFCHRPDKNTPIEETVHAMNTLIQQGKILYWGTSEWSAAELMEAFLVAEKDRLIAPTMEQPQYNMFERTKMEKDFLHLFKHYGLGTTIWSPLASGLLTGKYNAGLPDSTRVSMEGLQWLKDGLLVQDKINKAKQLTELAKSMGVSVTHLSLAWCLKNLFVSSVILGASKVEQLKENLKCLDAVAKHTPEVMEKIEAILQNKPVQPGY
ncbi:MAG: aldo/keto reductase [Bacteroidetes bacterium]|nr:aldo/keto reductase [Bacteroidota bacterium]